METQQVIDNQTEEQPQIEAMSDEELDALEAKVRSLEEETPAQEDGQPEEPAPEEPPAAPPLEKIVADQKVMIGRQSTEIGELRKQVAELRQMLQKPPEPPADEPKPDENEEFFKAPIEKVKAILEERERKRAEDEEAGRTARLSTRERVVEAVPDFDEIVSDVFTVLLQDGFPEEAVASFARDPWKEKPEALIALARRARAERRLRELEEKQKPAAPEKPKATAPRNQITASTGTSRGGATYLNGLTDQDIARMSDEELNAILKKAGG